MNNDSLSEAIAETIIDSRHKKQMSQERLGFESNLHRTYISLLERRKRMPTIETIFSIAHSLGVSPSEIIQEIESRYNKLINK